MTGKKWLKIIVDKWPDAFKRVAVIALVFSQSSYADSYLCEAERARGITYDQDIKSWEVFKLSIENSKYLVSPTDANDNFIKALKYDYEIMKVSSKQQIIHCKTPKNTDSKIETGLITFPALFWGKL